MTVQMYLNTALIAIIGAVAGYIIQYVNTKTTALKNMSKTTQEKDAITKVDGIITTVVNSLNQTAVDDIKKSNGGKLTEEEKDIYKQQAINNVLSLVQPEIMDLLDTLFGDVKAWLGHKIESYIKESKSNHDA